MIWIKLAKPAFVVRNFVRGFLHGAVDEVADTFTDPEIIRFGDTAKMLDICAKKTADPSSITLLKMTLIRVCTKFTTLLKEALPEKIIVP